MGIINLERYTIAIVLLVLFLLVFTIVWGIKTFGKSSPKTIPYPPYYTPCPDYWDNLGNGMCKPIRMSDSQGNPTQNGNANCDPTPGVAGGESLKISGQKPVNIGGHSNKNKCIWAKQCKVYWDGISDKDCSEL